MNIDISKLSPTEQAELLAKLMQSAPEIIKALQAKKDKNRRLSKEEVEQVCIALRAGENIDEIATKYEITTVSVRYWADKLGIKMDGRKRKNILQVSPMQSIPKEKKPEPSPEIKLKKQLLHKRKYQREYARDHRALTIRKRHMNGELTPKGQARHDEMKECPFCFPDSPWVGREDEWISVNRARNMSAIEYAKRQEELKLKNAAKIPQDTVIAETTTVIQEIQQDEAMIIQIPSSQSIQKELQINEASRHKLPPKQQRRLEHKIHKKLNNATGGFVTQDLI